LTDESIAAKTSCSSAIILPMPDSEWIRKLCLSLPDVTEDLPWADDLCFKVRGKIFTGMALSDGRFPRITLKAAPAAFHELLEIYGISPSPYVGRYKWITLANPNVLPEDELQTLIRQSYDLVAAKAPKKKPPRKRTSRKRGAHKKAPTKHAKK
jgi:predicted DNA-binding protein (MmcQ/YjbR family)